MQILLLDNHDSFTWNLAELLRNTRKVTFNIVRAGDFTPGRMEGMEAVIFSPGPGLPEEQPAMFAILEEIERRSSLVEPVPAILGVCLGMQAIALHFGGKLFNLPAVVHGQPRKLEILRRNHPMFIDMEEPIHVGLYHSWAVDRESLPGCLDLLATSPGGIPMAIAHKTLPVWGVQFHPESVMTPGGPQLVLNWIGNHQNLSSNNKP